MALSAEKETHRRILLQIQDMDGCSPSGTVKIKAYIPFYRNHLFLEIPEGQLQTKVLEEGRYAGRQGHTRGPARVTHGSPPRMSTPPVTVYIRGPTMGYI